jgi:hypothetical protein
MGAAITGDVEFASGQQAAGLGFEVVPQSTPAVVDSVLTLGQPGRRYVLDASGGMPDGFELEEGTYTLLFDNGEEVEIVVGSGASYAIDELISGSGSSAAASAYRASGIGSPEGNTRGEPGWTYMDRTTGDIYVKRTGTGTTGWEQRI